MNEETKRYIDAKFDALFSLLGNGQHRAAAESVLVDAVHNHNALVKMSGRSVKDELKAKAKAAPRRKSGSKAR